MTTEAPLAKCALCNKQARSQDEQDDWKCYGCDHYICEEHEEAMGHGHELEAHGAVD